jgi:prepilin-type N-terminal cleavage/methylation domain-containing protein
MKKIKNKSNISKKKLNKKGFTLIEVLICIVLFAIGATMLIGVIYTSMQISMRATAKYRTQLKSAAGLEAIQAGQGGLVGTGDLSDVRNEPSGQHVVVIFGNPD